MSNEISNDRLNDICRVGQGSKCCRYIGAGVEGLECLKHTELKSQIDMRVKRMIAQGDNCRGLKE